MPHGELKIRTSQTSGWLDAYDVWGVSLDETGMSRLMTPAPNKQPVNNKSELEHGKSVIYAPLNVMKDERTISLVMHLTANRHYSSSHGRWLTEREDFFIKYKDFCEKVLDAGYIEMATCYIPRVVYRLLYVDCTQFSEFMLGLAKFTLSLNEPNPYNRGISHDDTSPF